MCLRCLPFLSHAPDSPPPSPQQPALVAADPPPLPLPSDEPSPSQLASDLAHSQIIVSQPSLTPIPVSLVDDSFVQPSVSVEQSYPPLQLPVLDFEFPAALPSAPVTPALITDPSAPIPPDLSPSVLPVSSLESDQSAPELEVVKNGDQDPELSPNGSSLETSHSENVLAEPAPPAEGVEGHHHHHHHHHFHLLHELGHQLKEQANHVKEEGSRHLQSMLNNLQKD